MLVKMTAQELSNGVPDAGHLYASIRAGRMLVPAGDLQETFGGMDQVMCSGAAGSPGFVIDCSCLRKANSNWPSFMGKIFSLTLLLPACGPSPTPSKCASPASTEPGPTVSPRDPVSGKSGPGQGASISTCRFSGLGEAHEERRRDDGHQAHPEEAPAHQEASVEL